MRVIGLEPTHLAAPDPKSGVSTNFTTPAVVLECKYRNKASKTKFYLTFFDKNLTKKQNSLAKTIANNQDMSFLPTKL